MPEIFIVWRDSVCIADDVAAPHELRLTVENPTTLRELTGAMQARHYLASVAGGATWILQTGENERPLAVFAQSWSAPRFLVDADQSARNYTSRDAQSHFYWIYWCQVCANRVFDALQNGEPWPDKYQR